MRVVTHPLSRPRTRAHGRASSLPLLGNLSRHASALERLLKRRRLIAREGACASSMASSSERLQQLQARYGVPSQLYGSVGYLPGIV